MSTPQTGDKTKRTQDGKTPLFREAAIRHRTRALFGDVILAAPLSSWVITVLLLIIMLGVLVFGLFAHVQVDGRSIPVWRWIFGATG